MSAWAGKVGGRGRAWVGTMGELAHSRGMVQADGRRARSAVKVSRGLRELREASYVRVQYEGSSVREGLNRFERVDVEECWRNESRLGRRVRSRWRAAAWTGTWAPPTILAKGSW